MALRRARNPEGRMSLGDHLRELRRPFPHLCDRHPRGGRLRLDLLPAGLRAAGGPVQRLQGRHPESVISLNFGNATAAFSQQLSIAIFVGIIASSPVWLYQVWAFIVPGLTKKETQRRAGVHRRRRPAVPRRRCGLAFYVLPKAVWRCSRLHARRAPPTSSRCRDYFTFVTRFILAFGCAFLLPVFLVALNAIGILPAVGDAQGLASGDLRDLRASSAVTTPTPDAFTMFLMAIPLVRAYFAGHPRQQAHRAAQGASTTRLGRRARRRGVRAL